MSASSCFVVTTVTAGPVKPKFRRLVRAAAAGGDHHHQQQQQRQRQQRVGVVGAVFRSAAVAAAAAATLSLGAFTAPPASVAGTPKGQGVVSSDAYGRTDVDRCSLDALGKGASTRAAFSDFATQQNEELYVNVEGCDFSNMDLSKEVLSGIKARGANFSNSIFPSECARADFSDANLSGTVLRSSNLFNTLFAGANLAGADLTGALASGARFGVDAQTGQAANLKGAVFEGTLLSTSDVRAMCTNRTLDFEGQSNLGC